MRISVALVGLLGLFATSAAAQIADPAPDLPARDASVGYSFLRETYAGASAPKDYKKGWVVSYAEWVGQDRVALVGEAGASYRQNVLGETQTLSGFLGGARLRLIRLGPAQTFAQTLFGIERFSEPGFSEQGFAFQPGGGIDVGFGRMWALRVQGDFRLAQVEGIMFKEPRFVAGIVWRGGS